MKEIRWHGRGGQGSFTAARLLGLSASLFENKHALAFPSFGPERRGAPVLGFTKIDDNKIHDRSEPKYCDYIVVLDDTLMNDSVIAGLKPEGKIILNTSNPKKFTHLNKIDITTVDATSLAISILGRPITNTAMIGTLAAVSGIVKIESVIEAIKAEMDDSLVPSNIRIVEESYRLIKESCLEVL